MEMFTAFSVYVNLHVKWTFLDFHALVSFSSHFILSHLHGAYCFSSKLYFCEAVTMGKNLEKNLCRFLLKYTIVLI